MQQQSKCLQIPTSKKQQWCDSIVAVIIPFVLTFPESVRVLFLSTFHSSQLLTPDINMSVYFDDKHGLKFINYLRRVARFHNADFIAEYTRRRINISRLHIDRLSFFWTWWISTSTTNLNCAVTLFNLCFWHYLCCHRQANSENEADISLVCLWFVVQWHSNLNDSCSNITRKTALCTKHSFCRQLISWSTYIKY